MNLQVNSKYLMDYTAQIAKDIRLSGSPEELRSFHYIEEKLKEFGLKTKLSFSDAYISLPLDSSLRIGEVDIPCITASMAAQTKPDGIESELLYIGNLEDLPRYRDQVKGKVVVFHGFAGRAHVQAAIAASAAACIFINGERLHNMIVSPVWGNPTPETFPMIPTIPVVSVNRYDGEQVVEQAKKGTMAHIITRVDVGWRKIPTLIAEIKGQEEADKYVLFSGHVDSWEYGAMDNASANAVMMEVGRILASQPLRRTLRIAFWSGHSHGRYAGSAFYADTHFRDLYENCLIHINVDSVGAIGASVVLEGNIMPLTKRLASSVIKDVTNQEFFGKPFGRSGDQSFWGAGVPSAFMAFSGQPYVEDPVDFDTQYMIKQFNNGPYSAGFGWWWHSTEDTMDKIDEQYLERDASAYLSYVSQCCNQPILPLDLEAGIDDLKRHLDAYKEKAMNHISWGPIDQALQSMIDIVAHIQEKSNSPLDDVQVRKLNQAIQVVARVIVRLIQVGASEFDPDLALPMPPIPLLVDIHQLIHVQGNEHEYMMLITKVQRRVNQVEYLLHEGTKTAKFVMGSF